MNNALECCFIGFLLGLFVAVLCFQTAADKSHETSWLGVPPSEATVTLPFTLRAVDGTPTLVINKDGSVTIEKGLRWRSNDALPSITVQQIGCGK